MARFSFKRYAKELRRTERKGRDLPAKQAEPGNEGLGVKEVMTTKPDPQEIIAPPIPSPESPTFEVPRITIRNFYKHPIFLARFFGYAIPIGFLLYVLYINYLPFGYHKTFKIDVGSPGDTTVSEFYLEPSKGLSERKKTEDGSMFRELNGVGKVKFAPKTILRNATLTVSTADAGISFIPPYVDFDPEEINWDSHWNFTQEIPKNLTNTNVFYFEGEPYFDGTSRLEIASSSAMFEDGPFTIYAEWKPKDDENDFQQIVGHFNWEILQNKKTVRFMIGRVDNAEGKFYNADYTIPDPATFFGVKHRLLGIYRPDPENGNGYIEIYIDGYFGSRVNIGKSIIWRDYNGNKNLTIGKSSHGFSTYYQGAIYDIRIRYRQLLKEYKNIYLNFDSRTNSSITIPFTALATTTLRNISVHVEQR